MFAIKPNRCHFKSQFQFKSSFFFSSALLLILPTSRNPLFHIKDCLHYHRYHTFIVNGKSFSFPQNLSLKLSLLILRTVLHNLSEKLALIPDDPPKTYRILKWVSKRLCERRLELYCIKEHKKSIIKGVIHPTSYSVVARLTRIFSKL